MIYTNPVPGVQGLTMAPITASVAKVALNGSDSNHESIILLAGAVMSSIKAGMSFLNFDHVLTINYKWMIIWLYIRYITYIYIIYKIYFIMSFLVLSALL